MGQIKHLGVGTNIRAFSKWSFAQKNRFIDLLALCTKVNFNHILSGTIFDLFLSMSSKLNVASESHFRNWFKKENDIQIQICACSFQNGVDKTIETRL